MISQGNIEETYGFLDGLTASLVVLFAVLFTVIVLIKARKLKAKLLTIGALMGSFTGLLWMGPCLNFLSVLLYNKPLSPIELYGILSYMWVAPALICAIYVGAELMFPKVKIPLFLTFVGLGIVFELFLFLDTKNSFTFQQRGNYIDSRFNYGHPTFWLVAFFLVSVFILVGIGSLSKAFQSTGVIKKKFLCLGFALILFVFIGIFDAFLTPGPILFIMRGGMIISAILIYIALKP